MAPEEDERPLGEPELKHQQSKNTICLSPNNKIKPKRLESEGILSSTVKHLSKKELSEEKEDRKEDPTSKKVTLSVPLAIEEQNLGKPSQHNLEIGSVYQVPSKVIGSGVDTTKDPGTIMDNNVVQTDLESLFTKKLFQKVLKIALVGDLQPTQGQECLTK